MLRTVLITSVFALASFAVVTPAYGNNSPLADTPEIAAALSAGGEPVTAKVLGVVCDFCAKAMNKMFGRYDQVAAVHVDLDTKTLSLVLHPGETLSDDALRKAVKKAGYKVDTITRSDAISQ